MAIFADQITVAGVGPVLKKTSYARSTAYDAGTTRSAAISAATKAGSAFRISGGNPSGSALGAAAALGHLPRRPLKMAFMFDVPRMIMITVFGVEHPDT